MRKFTTRAIGTLTAALAICAVSGGVASAAQTPSIWLLPGVDVSSLLAPTVDLPTQVLKPVDGLLTLLNG